MKKLAEDIMQEYGNMIFRMAYASMRNRADAQDVLQDVLVSFIKSNPDFDNEHHVKAWLIKTTANRCKNMHLSAWFRLRNDVEDFDIVYEDKTPREDILAAINQLNANERLLIHLFYYEEYTSAEIADLLHKNENTIRSQLARARKKLKADLEEELANEK